MLLPALLKTGKHRSLEMRGYSTIDSATFLTISSFTNSGFTLTNDNLIGLSNSPLAYIILSLLIIFGNTALPFGLRYFTKMIKHFTRSSTFERIKMFFNNINHVQYYEDRWEKFHQDMKYILKYPRYVTSHIFSKYETYFLTWIVFGLYFIEFMFFVVSSLSRKRLYNNYSVSQLIGIGYFQSISTRSAGFNIINIRSLNQGLLVIIVLMMYISAAPFVSTLYKSGQHKIRKYKVKKGKLWFWKEGTNKINEMEIIKKDTDKNLIAISKDDSAINLSNIRKRRYFSSLIDTLEGNIEVLRDIGMDNKNGNNKDKGNGNSNTVRHINIDNPSNKANINTTNDDNYVNIQSVFAKKYLFRHSFCLLLGKYNIILHFYLFI